MAGVLRFAGAGGVSGLLVLVLATAGPGSAQGGGLWTRVADLPTPRAGLAACVLDGRIYAIGGVPSGTFTGFSGTVEVYDPDTDAWTRRADMPVVQPEVTSAVLEGRIYTVGSTLMVHAYDPATDTWTRKTDMPARASWLRGAALGRRIYAVGGVPGGTNGQPHPEVYAYDSGRPDLVRRADMAATLVAGQSTSLPLRLELNGPAADGTFPPVMLDLSAVGVPDPQPFTHRGQGQYGVQPIVTAPANGRFPLPVWMAPPGLPRELLHDLRLTVLPAGDLVLFGDEPATGWTWRAEQGTLDAAATARVYQGQRSLAVQASGTWRLHAETTAPVSDVGYTTLRLVLSLGEATGTSLEADLNAPPLLKRQTQRVDWRNRAWQVVEIPLDSLHYRRGTPISTVDLKGITAGTFYLDEVRLVAVPPPPTTAVLEEHAVALPRGMSLDQNYPNPFNSSTVIRYALPQAQPVELALFDVAGQRVATLAADVRDAGRHAVTWDGRDDGGRLVATGVYLCRLRAGDQVQARTVLVLR
ncbi:MAG: FlgD immunoglobulin-like domain containing protein [Candidatus Latescibacterota bacterium]